MVCPYWARCPRADGGRTQPVPAVFRVRSGNLSDAFVTDGTGAIKDRKPPALNPAPDPRNLFFTVMDDFTPHPQLRASEPADRR